MGSSRWPTPTWRTTARVWLPPHPHHNACCEAHQPVHRVITLSPELSSGSPLLLGTLPCLVQLFPNHAQLGCKLLYRGRWRQVCTSGGRLQSRTLRFRGGLQNKQKKRQRVQRVRVLQCDKVTVPHEWQHSQASPLHHPAASEVRLLPDGGWRPVAGHPALPGPALPGPRPARPLLQQGHTGLGSAHPQ